MTTGDFYENTKVVFDEKVLKRVERSDLTDISDAIVVVVAPVIRVVIIVIVVNGGLVVSRKDGVAPDIAARTTARTTVVL